jgi:hypothetical protein
LELEEFVSNTLVQVMHGIMKAQKEWSSKCSGYGVISPAWDGPDDYRNRTQNGTFDVAITAASKSEGDGGGGIKVIALADVSGKFNRSVESSTVSRISFSVPILPPTTTIEKR